MISRFRFDKKNTGSRVIPLLVLGILTLCQESLASASSTFTHDANGNITQRIDDGKVTTYEYDLMNRLKSVTLPDGTKKQFFYGLGEQAKLKVDSDASEKMYLYEGHEILLEARTIFRCDVNGDGSVADPVDLAFMVDHLFAGGVAPSPELRGDCNGDGQYDPVDLSTLVDALFSGGTGLNNEPLDEVESRRILRAASQTIAEIKNTGGIEFVHTDHLGSVSLKTDISGNVLSEKAYDPYGQLLEENGNIGPRDFTGKELDEDTNLHDYGARKYASDLGRFLQRDTKEDEHPYTYVNNNPLKLIDPSGHDPQGEHLNANWSSPANILSSTWDTMVENWTNFWTTVDEMTKIPRWTDTIRQWQAATPFLLPGPRGGTPNLIHFVPASGVDVAATVIDVANGPLPEYTIAKTGGAIFATAGGFGRLSRMRGATGFSYVTKELVDGVAYTDRFYGVRYFDLPTRQSHELFLLDNRLLDFRGNPIDTRDGFFTLDGGVVAGDGFAMFAMSGDGSMYFHKFGVQGEIHHSSLLSGEPAAAAGEIMVHDGRLIQINNRTGHYMIPEMQNVQAIYELEARGLSNSGSVLLQNAETHLIRYWRNAPGLHR